MCMLRDCGVCECEPDEVPAPWKDADSTAASCEGTPLRLAPTVPADALGYMDACPFMVDA